MYEPYFERFLDLIKIKIDPIYESKFIYAVLYSIRDSMQSAINYKSSQTKIYDIGGHVTDLLFQYYMQ